MSRVTDYSKWDHIDLSDDEETYHPNIDSSLMIKINREQRARREAEEKKERDQVANKGFSQRPAHPVLDGSSYVPCRRMIIF